MEATNKDLIRLMKTAAYYHGASFANFPLFFFRVGNPESIPNLGELYLREYNRLLVLTESMVCNNSELLQFRRDTYRRNYEKILNFMSEEFSFFEWPELHLVDSLPIEGIGNSAWDATVVDRQESKRLGLEEGIYYNKNCVTHCYFEFIICHELIHWIISNHSVINPAYVSLWEEGYCDFLSLFLLYKGGVLPKEAILNIVLYNRHFKEANSLWKRYHSYLNNIINISLQSGKEYIYSFLRSGRLSFSKLYHSNPQKECSEFTDDELDFLHGILSLNTYISVPDSVYILLSSLNDISNEFILFDTAKRISGLNQAHFDAAIKYAYSTGLLFIENTSLYLPNKDITTVMRFDND